jgi:hypothetical protein
VLLRIEEGRGNFARQEPRVGLQQRPRVAHEAQLERVEPLDLGAQLFDAVGLLGIAEHRERAAGIGLAALDTLGRSGALRE